ncbi:MAG: TonB-dependent receptor family protein, partial [Prevotella sp.]|nr:TonB-dependent receptor family protein [Prevotella sp.]
YQISNSPLKNSLHNVFGGESTSFIDLTDRYSDGHDNTTDHIFQVDYSLPLGQGHNLDLGSKLLLHNATSDSKYYLNDIYNEAMSMDYSYKNTVLAGYAEYSAKWSKFGAKAGMRYEHTWQKVEYRLGTGADFSTDYGSLVPTASLSYSIAPTQNIGLTYNMRISRPGITYLNPYVNRADPTTVSYGNSDLDVEKSHNVSLVFNSFSQKLMLNATLRYSYSGNGIDQYSFYDGNILNTTYGNIVERNQIGLNVYANWLLAKNTRLFFNGGVDYSKMNSDMLGVSNSGWHFNSMAGVQQTLPWDLKLGAYLINSSKTYTMQGWSTGFNIVTMSLSKTFFDDKLSVGIQALTGLSSGGNIKMDTYSKGKDFEMRQNIHVPIKSISLTVSYTFGKKNQQMKQHRSRVENDYIEQQSQGEMLNNVGGGMQQQQPQ